MSFRILASLLLLSSCISTDPDAPPSGARTVSGTASVIDGDTIEIHGARIRLFGLDAPESDQICDRDGKAWRCGTTAANALVARIGRNPVLCEERDVDHYGRSIAICSLDGSDLNRWLVSDGWAVAYRAYSGLYVSAEDDARRHARGLWTSRFDMPWDWRRSARAGTPAEKTLRPVNSNPDPLSLFRTAASYSCTPKRTCPKISSCDEARWLLANCSWVAIWIATRTAFPVKRCAPVVDRSRPPRVGPVHPTQTEVGVDRRTPLSTRRGPRRHAPLPRSSDLRELEHRVDI